MRKFSKLLLLTLTLVMAVALLTVVTFAAAESGTTTLTPKTMSVTGKGYHAVSKDGTFDNPDTDYSLPNGASKHGKWSITVADNGNRYAVSEYEVGTGTAYENFDVMTTTSRATYNVKLYPSFAIDFDIMSNVGLYDYASIRPDLYATETNGRIMQMGGVDLNKIGLPKTVDTWNHVTMIVTYTGKGIFERSFYVNGVLTLGPTVIDVSQDANWLTRVDENGDLVANNVLVNAISIYPPRGTEKVSYDNFLYTYYPAQYSAADIASYFYNENYVMPYGFTEAKIGDNVYDDVTKAIAAAGAEDTVKLTKNADTKLLIDKNLVIDANVYDENGVATGSFYTFEYESTKGFVHTEISSGVYSFARSPYAVDVIWDAACEGECDCFLQYGGHKLTSESVLILGQIPAYHGELPTFEFDYSTNTLKKFIGWSYANDSTVDTLVAITADDVSAGVVKLYPVYATVTCDIEVISGNTSVYYEVGADFPSIFTAAADGSTVKLLSDVYVECGSVELKKNITLDLNGKALKRCNVYGKTYEATKSGDSFVFGTDGTAVETSSDTPIFRVKASNKTIKITSSKSGGVIYNSAMSATSWTYEGELIKRDYVSWTSGSVVALSYSHSNSGTHLIVDGDVSMYAHGLWYQDSGSLSGTKITIDGLKFYHTATNNTTPVINARTNADCTITVENSFFYTNPNIRLINLGASDVGNQTGDIVASFVNCDFFKVDASYSLGVNVEKTSSVKSVTFDNCRMLDVSGGVPTAVNGCLQINGKYNAGNSNGSQGVSMIAAGSGYTSVATSVTYVYSVPTTLSFAKVTGDIATPDYNFTFNDRSVTYNSIVSKPVNVNWVDLDGNTTTTTEYPGAIVTAPEIVLDIENDNYRNLVVQWADQNGKAITTLLAYNADTKTVDFETAEYTFYAKREIDGKSKYVGTIQNAMLNLTYYGHFAYYLYVPVQEGVTLTQLGDYGPSSISVKIIDGVEYWCANTGWIGPANAVNNKNATVKYTIDGVNYERKMSVSAKLYSEILLSDPNTAEVEKKAVISLMAYSEEAYKNLAGGTLTDEVAEKFNSFFDTYTEGVRPSAHDFTAEKITVNEDAIKGLIQSMNFRIYGSENRLSFVVTLSKEAVDLGYTVQVFGVASGINKAGTANADGSVNYYTNNNGLIGGIMSSSYTINILDKDGKIVTRDLDDNPETPAVAATTHYNLATYCAATQDSLSIALFTFGKDATAARAYLETK